MQNYSTYKKTETVTHLQKKKITIDTNPHMILMLELAEGNFKAIIITMLNEVKENMFIVKEKTAAPHQRNKSYLKKQQQKETDGNTSKNLKRQYLKKITHWID